jgi:hypothetical protein
MRALSVDQHSIVQHTFVVNRCHLTKSKKKKGREKINILLGEAEWRADKKQLTNSGQRSPLLRFLPRFLVAALVGAGDGEAEAVEAEVVVAVAAVVGAAGAVAGKEPDAVDCDCLESAGAATAASKSKSGTRAHCRACS